MYLTILGQKRSAACDIVPAMVRYAPKAANNQLFFFLLNQYYTQPSLEDESPVVQLNIRLNHKYLSTK